MRSLAWRPTDSSSTRPTAGTLIAGRFRLRGEIGRGSMGEVWLAEHDALGSPVAVKFLRPDARHDPWIVKRFLEEARIAASLQTRHVVRVLDFGETEAGLPFVVMEYLDGETLEARLRRHGRLPPAVTVRLLGDAARALARAHSMGVVHRDFKPANLFLATDEDGFVTAKVIDFGVAKRVATGDALPASRSRPRIRRGDEALARESANVALARGSRDRRDTRDSSPDETDDRMPGTLVYMAPEQLRGARLASAASDQWAFAVVAYSCLTGKLPFARLPLEAFADAVGEGGFERPTQVNPALPEAIDAWMEKALSIDPRKRFANMVVCADALREALGVPVDDVPRVEAPTRRRVTPPARTGQTALAALCLVTALAWIGSGRILGAAAKTSAPSEASHVAEACAPPPRVVEPAYCALAPAQTCEPSAARPKPGTGAPNARAMTSSASSIVSYRADPY